MHRRSDLASLYKVGGRVLALTSLSQLKNSIVDGTPGPLVVGRRANVRDQLELIRTEFSGKSELCYELAKTIVLIRRELDLSDNVGRFFEILNYDSSDLIKSLSVRWLTSVCDTIADHGAIQQRSAAVCMSTFVNLVKLAETERLLSTVSEISESSYLENWPHDLGDGLSSYHIHRGDLVRNLISRINRCLNNEPLLEQVFGEIVSRFQASENMLSRLAKLNPEFWELRQQASVQRVEQEPPGMGCEGSSNVGGGTQSNARNNAIAIEVETTPLLRQLEALAPWHFDIPLGHGLRTTDGNRERYEDPDKQGVGTVTTDSLRGLLGNLFPEGMQHRSFLDAGCNGGGYCFLAKELGASRVVGFDVREHWIRQARFLATVLSQDVSDMQFHVSHVDDFDAAPRSFSITLLKGVFYHLPNPITALESLCSLTEEMIIVDTASKQGIPSNAMATRFENQTQVMSGVDHLAWLPGGPEAVGDILKWQGFPHFRVDMNHHHWPGGLPDWGRFRMIAARDEQSFADYDSAIAGPS